MNVWTIHNENQLKEIRGQFDMITFQELGRERIHEYLKEEQNEKSTGSPGFLLFLFEFCFLLRLFRGEVFSAFDEVMINVFPFRVDEGGHRGEDGVDDVIDGEEEDVEDGLPKRQQEVLPFPDDDDEIDEEARDIGPGK